MTRSGEWEVAEVFQNFADTRFNIESAIAPNIESAIASQASRALDSLVFTIRGYG